MKMPAKAVAVATLAVFTGAIALAQTPADPAKTDKREQRAAQMKERFKNADKNNDGKISREEANASLPKIAKHFDEIDANKDGFVTPEEMKAAHDRHGERKAAAK